MNMRPEYGAIFFPGLPKDQIMTNLFVSLLLEIGLEHAAASIR